MYKSTFKIPTELLCKRSRDSDFVHTTDYSDWKNTSAKSYM